MRLTIIVFFLCQGCCCSSSSPIDAIDEDDTSESRANEAFLESLRSGRKEQPPFSKLGALIEGMERDEPEEQPSSVDKGLSLFSDINPRSSSFDQEENDGKRARTPYRDPPIYVRALLQHFPIRSNDECVDPNETKDSFGLCRRVSARSRFMFHGPRLVQEMRQRPDIQHFIQRRKKLARERIRSQLTSTSSVSSVTAEPDLAVPETTTTTTYTVQVEDEEGVTTAEEGSSIGEDGEEEMMLPVSTESESAPPMSLFTENLPQTPPAKNLTTIEKLFLPFEDVEEEIILLEENLLSTPEESPPPAAATAAALQSAVPSTLMGLMLGEAILRVTETAPNETHILEFLTEAREANNEALELYEKELIEEESVSPIPVTDFYYPSTPIDIIEEGDSTPQPEELEENTFESIEQENAKATESEPISKDLVMLNDSPLTTSKVTEILPLQGTTTTAATETETESSLKDEAVSMTNESEEETPEMTNENASFDVEDKDNTNSSPSSSALLDVINSSHANLNTPVLRVTRERKRRKKLYYVNDRSKNIKHD